MDIMQMEFIIRDADRRMEEAFAQIRLLVKDARNKIRDFDANLRADLEEGRVKGEQLASAFEQRKVYINNICLIVSEVERALGVATAFKYLKVPTNAKA